MSVPGDRREIRCRGCHAKILLIYTAHGKWMPSELFPSKVNGERLLVFANGVVGRTYGDFEGGHESHFVYCPNAVDFRKNGDKDAQPLAQGVLGFEPEPE